MNNQFIPLYIAHDIVALDALVKKDDAIKNLKKVNFSNIARKMMMELFQSQNDQEKSYILGKRYLNLMDHLFKISDDPNYTKSLYINDYQKVSKLISEVKSDLNQRYLALEQETTKSGDGTDDETISYGISAPLEPQTKSNSTANFNSLDSNSNKLFHSEIDEEGIFIGPRDLFKALKQKQNMLLVDIRSPNDFTETRILIENYLEECHIINIPENFIIPGLSANTLGQKLEPEGQLIWDMRDKFEIIVLFDTNTQKYNFGGSKLERLRSFIVEWDFNRTYTREPFVLSGGIKEFIEWYPTEVGNSHIFLSQTNSEIDELLNLESISYPETGTGLQMNLKLHLNSINNEESNGIIKSEIEVPANHQSSLENIVELYESLSQDSLAVNHGTTEVEPKLPSKLEVDSSSDDESETEIREMVASNKAALLLKARQAAKPIIHGATKENHDLHNIKRTLDQRISQKNKPGIPSIDRSFKPVIPYPNFRKKYGYGYCGLRNVKNICYMNSILQCMKVIPVLQKTFIMSDDYIRSTTLKPPRINPQMAQVLRELWGGTPENPKQYFIEPFKKKLCETAPNFDRGNHEDAFEFFIFLFNLISEDSSVDLRRVPVMTEREKAWYGHLQGRSSFLVDAFYYQLKNTKTCCNCYRTNLSFDTDSTLMLAMRNATCSLQSMIEEYMKDNRVRDYSCSYCKSTDTIMNRKEIIVDPDVLVIVLKRYLINPDGTSRKNDNEIDFPLKGLRFGKSNYNCCGVVQHSGNTNHGHYFASVLLDDTTNNWVLFNDEVITKYSTGVNETFGVRVSAAGFFYIRQDY